MKNGNDSADIYDYWAPLGESHGSKRGRPFVSLHVIPGARTCIWGKGPPSSKASCGPD